MQSKDNVFKILTIDGGGIKGLYSAFVLARIEEKTAKKNAYFFLKITFCCLIRYPFYNLPMALISLIGWHFSG